MHFHLHHMDKARALLAQYQSSSIGDDFDRTLERDALLTSYGILTLHVTPRRLRESPTLLVKQLVRTLDLAAAGSAPA